MDKFCSFGKLFFLFLLFAVSGFLFFKTDTLAYLTDTSSHPPPTFGSYPYSPPGNWLPGSVDFLGLGQTYIDPVFNTTIRRITNLYPNTGDSDLYAKNASWNADGTRISQSPSFKAIDTTTGAIVRSLPRGGETTFDPNFSDVFYYFSGTTLRKFLLSTGASYVVKDFGVDVTQHLGQSVDSIDNSGRYFVVNVNGQVKVLDTIDSNGRLPGDPAYVSQASGQGLATPGDAGHGGLFNGSFSASFSGGYIGITPSADGVFMTTSTLYWYPLNLITKTMNSSGISRTPGWNGADHGDVVSASDGNSYFIGLNGGMPDVAIMLWNLTQGGSATTLLHVGYNYSDAHLSGIPRGSLRDWMTVDLEYGASGDADLAAWEPFHQEIFLVNVLNGSVRRYAHHRSQNTTGSYMWEPRVSANWDGTKIAYVSNYGYTQGSYSDMYVAELGGSSETPTPTQKLTPTPACPLISQGDLDCSGKINAFDTGLLILHWGQSYPAGDMKILLGNWGKTD